MLHIWLSRPFVLSGLPLLAFFEFEFELKLFLLKPLPPRLLLDVVLDLFLISLELQRIISIICWRNFILSMFRLCRIALSVFTNDVLRCTSSNLCYLRYYKYYDYSNLRHCWFFSLILSLTSFWPRRHLTGNWSWISWNLFLLDCCWMSFSVCSSFR